MTVDATDRRLLNAIATGLPLVPAPYAAVAEELGLSEGEVTERLTQLQRRGVVSRFGVIVRHHELGYQANAMVAWDVPDRWADGFGKRLAGLPCVTLCYRRRRALPHWPYNLFCMVHGRDRQVVEGQIAALAAETGLAAYPQTVLFSRRRFKQRGARYGHVDADRAGRRGRW